MPRQPRRISMTGMYHIMIRGINREQIFCRTIYKNKILDAIIKIREEFEFYIIAYCVMNNHMHLLIKIEDNFLELFMKKLNVRFAIFYNKVEDRYGHVFQDRFKSEAVEDESYFIGAIRYIHNNPVKAGMINHIEKYTWSSAKDYINQDSKIISDKYLREVISLFKNIDDFINFHSLDDDNIYVDTAEEEKENIQILINKIIAKFVNENNINDNSRISKRKREELAEILLKLDLITYREIAGLCNLSYYRVFDIAKALKKENQINMEIEANG